MKLLIVESPAKAKTIGKYLGAEFVVTASNGHVRSLPSKKGSVLPEEDFAMFYELTPNASKSVPKIVSLAKQADSIYLATDPDREGEAIAWHIVETLKSSNAITDKSKIFRVTFYEITKAAVLKAISEPRSLETSLIKAQQARQALDYLVGFTLSPLLWRKLPSCRSAGRVQSVALRLICERETEILSFHSEEYWSLQLDFHTQKDELIKAKLIQFEGKKLEKLDIKNQEAALLVKTKIQEQQFKIAEIKNREQKRNPLPPFNTSTLQQDASHKLGFSVKKTMQVAQGLYEGVEIAGEEKALITYMRTDGVTISDEALNQIRDYISKAFDQDHVPNKPNVYKTKTKNAQEAHEAIRPIQADLNPNQLKNHLNQDQYKLYKLIWQRTIASQMNPATTKILTIDISSIDSSTLARANESFTDPKNSYLVVYEKFKDVEESEEESQKNTPLLPLDLKHDQDLKLEKIDAKQHFTEAPPRFTEASLVKTMEELGIGRPSTYATIISVLQERSYVTLEQKRFVSDPRGAVLTTFLVKFFSNYFNYDFTANLENELDSVARGELDWKLMLQNFWLGFHTQVKDLEKKNIEEITVAISSNLESYVFPNGRSEEQKKCPICQSPDPKLKFGKFGMFLTCAKYPDCKFAQSVLIPNSSDTNSNIPKEIAVGRDIDGNAILFGTNMYGKYLKMESESGVLIKRVNLPKEYTSESLDLALALKLVSLPRTICINPDNDKEISLNISKFGPYLKCEDKTVNVNKIDQPLEIQAELAIEIVRKAKDKPKGRAFKKTTKTSSTSKKRKTV